MFYSIVFKQLHKYGGLKSEGGMRSDLPRR